MALCAPTHNLSLSSVKSHARRRPRSRRGYGTGMVAMAASYEYEEGQLERPKWAGQTPLSHLVRTIISFKPLYSLLKLGARNVLIRSLCLSHTHTHTQRRIHLFSWVLEVILGCGWNRTAEKKNIPWREMTKEILESDVYKELERIQNPSLVYPDCNSLFHQCPILFPFGIYQFFFLVKLNYMIKFSIY